MDINNEVIQIINTSAKLNAEYFPVMQSSKDIAKYIGAFANTHGGYIIFGAVRKLTGDIEVNGLGKDFYVDKIINEALSIPAPKPELFHQYISYNGKKILAIKVKKSQAIVKVNDDIYIREDGKIKKYSEGVEMDKTKAFIVHGHDELAKEETARFVEKLGLEAIILHEQASGGDTIIEKIERYSNVGFGIVLYTPCDLGKSKNDLDLKNRARQNVIFEHGYLIGKIGRRNVCALVKEEIEKPNDISGVVYINMDKNGSWKIALAKEMKNAGYHIDLNKI